MAQTIVRQTGDRHKRFPHWWPHCGRVGIFFALSLLIVSAMTSYAVGANLMVNGDFELGNDGSFTTDYQFDPSGGIGFGEYNVVTDPKFAHFAAASYGDHTSGMGLMMVINGGLSTDRVWEQTVPVTPNTVFDFFAWVSSWFFAPQAQLEFQINGIQIGTTFSAPTQLGVWQQFTASWNSGVSTSAKVTIFDRSGAFGGNDFALDDIALIPRDPDGDGILGSLDVCLDTLIPESVPTDQLGVNRFALTDGDTTFDTTPPSGKGPNRSYTTADTCGCSCEQIIDELGLGQGHVRRGCSISAMDAWVTTCGSLVP